MKRRPTASHTEARRTKSPPTSRRPQCVRPIHRFLNYEVHSPVYLALVGGLPHPLLALNLVYDLRLILGQLATLRRPGVQNDLLDAINPLTQLRAPARGPREPERAARLEVPCRTTSGPLCPTSWEAAHLPMN